MMEDDLWYNPDAINKKLLSPNTHEFLIEKQRVITMVIYNAYLY